MVNRSRTFQAVDRGHAALATTEQRLAM